VEPSAGGTGEPIYRLAVATGLVSDTRISLKPETSRLISGLFTRIGDQIVGV
jgi:hypothetical protein